MNKTKKSVLLANRWIVEKGLVELTWGNVSFYNNAEDLIYIKPSGIDLLQANIDDVSCIDSDGKVRSGLKPSVDMPTHLKIYEKFDNVASVVHTHSKYATVFAQAGRPIPCLGTTHADYFYGTIPCIPHPNSSQIKENYEAKTGEAICDYFRENNIDPLQMQACLIKGHAPFIWGKTIESALENAYVLEIIAEFAYKTLKINPKANLARPVLNKHFLRKHGKDKYYGQ